MGECAECSAAQSKHSWLKVLCNSSKRDGMMACSGLFRLVQACLIKFAGDNAKPSALGNWIHLEESQKATVKVNASLVG